MSWNRSRGENTFFQRIVLLMSFSLILLFAAYELLEAQPKSFLVMKIIDFKEKDDGFSLKLFLSNDSSEKREGFLILLIGYDHSRVSENATHYFFTGFETLNFSVVTLNPGERRKLSLNLTPNPGAKRIIAVYYCDRGTSVQAVYRNPMLLRRDGTVWVQTWVS